MRAAASITGRSGVDQPWVFLQQRFRTDAELVHGAGAEVLEQHVRPLCQTDDQFTPCFRLEVDGDGLFQSVQHGEREALCSRRTPQSLSQGRLDLDDTGTRHSQQIAGIGTVVDLTEVEDRHTGKRLFTHVLLPNEYGAKVCHEAAHAPRRAPSGTYNPAFAHP